MSEDFEALLSQWPVSSDRPALLRATCEKGPNARRRALAALRASMKQSPPTEQEAHALLTATRAYPAPPIDRYDDPAETAVYEMSRHVAYPSLVPSIVAALEVPRTTVQRSLLALLVHIGTAPAADALVQFFVSGRGSEVKLYGPASEEIERLFPWGDRVIPAILRHAPGALELLPKIDAALGSGQLDASAREAIEPVACELIDALVEKARPHQQDEGVEWRFEDEYRCWVRDPLVDLCKLARLLRGPGSLRALRAATALADPLPSFSALASLVERGERADEALVARLAESHEVRRPLFELLERHRQSDLFPASARTPEAFAAADLVEHVIASDIGEEPAGVELAAALDLFLVGRMYVFRLDTPEGEIAGISGPAPSRDTGRPFYGERTACDPEPFDSATPKQHAKRLLRG